MLSGKLERFAEAQSEHTAEGRGHEAAFAFIGSQDYGLAGSVERAGYDLVPGGDAVTRIDHEQDGAGLLDGSHCLARHAGAKTFSAARVLETRGIDQTDRQTVKRSLGHLAVAGDARRIMDDRDAPPGNAVKEAGLSHIGAPDNGKRERHHT